jgi:GAF domain-containing protein
MDLDRDRGDGILARISTELAGTEPDLGSGPEAVLRRATVTLSKLLSGTWVAALMGTDPETMTVVAADGEEPRLARYVEEMHPPGAAPTASFSLGVIERNEAIFVPCVSYQEFLQMLRPEVVDRLEREPLPLLDPAPRISFAVVPMRADGETIGTLGLFERASSNTLAERDVQWLQAIADQIAISAAQSQLKVAARDRLERLNAVRCVALAIAGSQDLRLTLQVILDGTIAGLAVDAADVLLFDEAEDVLRIVATIGFHSPSIPAYRLAVHDEVSGEQMLGEGFETLTSAVSSTESSRRTLFAREGFRGRRAVSLVARGKLNGVLEVFSRSQLRRDREWLDFFRVLASETAIAIERAAILEQLEKSTSRANRTGRIPPPDLNRLQSQILGLAVDGLTNREIAERVHLSDHTIKFHLRQILHTVGVSNRTELARKATLEGWL